MAQNNHFPRSVWVSFSGRDSALVQQMTDYLYDSYHQENNSEAQYPVYLRTYCREETVASEPIRKQEDNNEAHQLVKRSYFLRPGDDIADLVHVIALNLRRLLVITPNYLQSEYCLWELCCCLISKIDYNVRIMSWGFEKPKAWLKESDFHFDDEQFKRGPTSLAVALAYVYRKFQNKMSKELLIDESGEDRDLVQWFSNALTTFEGKIDLTEDFKFQLGGLLTESQLAEKCGQIVTYARSVELDGEIEQINSLVVGVFSDWLSQFDESSKKAREHFAHEYGKEFKVDFLLDICIDELEDFTQCLINDFSELKQPKENHIKQLEELAGLLSLLLIDKEWAAEMRRCSFGGVNVRFTYPMEYLAINEAFNTVEFKEKKSFETHVANNLIQLTLPSIRFKQNQEVYKYYPQPDLDSRINVRRGTWEQKKGHCQTELVNKCLINLLCKLLVISSEKAEKIITKNNWQDRLHSKLRRQVDENGLCNHVYFYLDRLGLEAEQINEKQEILQSLMGKINHGFEAKEHIKIGLLTVTDRDDGNTIHYIDAYYKSRNNRQVAIQNMITDLMEAVHEKATPARDEQ